MTLEGSHNLWGDLHHPKALPQDTTFTVMGVPFDGLANARKGAAQGPARLRYWSRHLTPFSEDRTPLSGVSVCDLGDIHIHHVEQDFKKVRAAVAGLPNVPIVLGGDHSVTIPIFEGQLRRFKDQRLGVLWIDAHPDLCDVFDGSKLSHACTMRRGLEMGLQPEDVVMVGLRSWEAPEVEILQDLPVHLFPMPQVEQAGIQAVAAQARALLEGCDAVHISLDIDCLDPAHAPGTGIPDAGGMTTRQVISLLKALQGLPLVGLDLVEVAPPLDPSEAAVLAGTKLIQEFIALFAREKLGLPPTV